LARIHAAVLGAELAHQRRQELLRRADHADHQIAAFELAQGGHHVLRVFQLGEHASRVGQQVLACQREVHLPRFTIEQRQPDLGLELLDLHRDRRRREVQLLGGPGKAQVACYRREHAELAQRHVLHR
jgi:hypothetical protein